MKIGDRIYVRGYVDEIRKDTVIVRNDGGYFGTIPSEVITGELPSVEKPFKLPKIYVADGFDTVEDEDGNIGFGVYVPDKNQIYVAGDVEDEIRARALLHEVCHWVQDMCGRPFDEDEANEFSDIVYDALPSAQPEIIRCKDCEYGEQDEVGRWFCRSLGCQIGNEDGSGFCADAERRE